LTDCSKIRTSWKTVIIFDHPRRTMVLDRRPGTAPQFCGPKFIDTGAMAVPIAEATRTAIVAANWRGCDVAFWFLDFRIRLAVADRVTGFA
jgi:hypothetical protein